MTDDFCAVLKEGISGKRVAVVGVGSELCADDAAGLYFVDLLSEKMDDDRFLFIKGGSAPENFTGQIKAFRPDTLLLIDAAFLGLEPGDYKFVDTDRITGLPFSTHMLPLPFLISYLEVETGCSTLVVGIQPVSTEQGFGMCGMVKQGVERLAGLFLSCL